MKATTGKSIVNRKKEVVFIWRINWKSKLCQLVGLTRLIEGGKIAEAFIQCENEEDESKMFRFNLYKDV